MKMAPKSIPPKKKAQKIPTSLFGRASRLIGTATKVVGREIASNISDRLRDRPEIKRVQTRIKQAHDLVESLGNLKGAAMKVGQLLSMEMSDLLPPEVVEILRTLHDNATFLPIQDIKKVLRKELGPERYKDIEELSVEPIASASIGQVHRARIKGEDVVLKIQYPGVADSIDTDVALLKKLITSLLAVRGKKISFDAVFSELADGLKLEIDYLLEAKSIQRYRATFAPFPQFVIPKVFEAYSTKQVLTLSYEHGERLNQWIKKPMTQAGKQHFSKKILDLLVLEFFTFGLVQTDPNYGNFLIRDEGKTLILLDFGAVRDYPPKFRNEIRSLLLCSINENREEMLERAAEFGFLDKRETAEVRDLFCQLMSLIASMFRIENQPFSFASESYLKQIRDTSFEFANLVQHTSPAHQIIFLNRKLGGMYHLLKDADCTVDVNAFWKHVEGLDLSHEVPQWEVIAKAL